MQGVRNPPCISLVYQGRTAQAPINGIFCDTYYAW